MKRCSLRCWVGLGTAWVYLLAGNPTLAQIVPDTTLPANSIVTNYNRSQNA